MKRLTIVAVAIAALFAAVAGAATTAGASSQASGDVVRIQLLDVSDWHAQLDPNDVNGTLIGGASVISTLWKQDRENHPNTLTLTAGDAFGASPPLSGFFDEEPAIRTMRLMGFDVDTFGNHNFDRGVGHLQRMIDLAGEPAATVPGKPFGYVSANLTNLDDNLDGVAPWRIFEVGGVKVGVVGITNPEAPGLVFPGSFGTMVPTDPVPAANKARAQARAAGAKILIAITHLGIAGTDPVTGEPAGPLTEFAENVGGFDVIFGDHTDVQFEKVINNALVIENRSKGLTYSRTFLDVDLQNGRIIDRSNRFIIPFASGVTRDSAIESMLQPYRTELAEVFDEKIATTTGVFVRGGNVERRQEVAIGDLIADALRETYGTQLGFTNSGGIRAALPSSYVPQDASLRRTGCARRDAVRPRGRRHLHGAPVRQYRPDARRHRLAAVGRARARHRVRERDGWFEQRLPPGDRQVPADLGIPVHVRSDPSCWKPCRLSGAQQRHADPAGRDHVHVCHERLHQCRRRRVHDVRRRPGGDPGHHGQRPPRVREGQGPDPDDGRQDHPPRTVEIVRKADGQRARATGPSASLGLYWLAHEHHRTTTSRRRGLDRRA